MRESHYATRRLGGACDDIEDFELWSFQSRRVLVEKITDRAHAQSSDHSALWNDDPPVERGGVGRAKTRGAKPRGTSKTRCALRILRFPPIRSRCQPAAPGR